MNSLSWSKNLQRNIIDSTDIYGDTIRVNDTDGTAWIIPCIDCFIRIKEVRKDKDACVEDNKKKDIIIMDLVADNKEWRNRTKIGIISGIISGVLGTYMIMK